MFEFDVRDRGRGELETWQRWVGREAKVGTRAGEWGDWMDGGGRDAGEVEREAGAAAHDGR